MENLIEKLQLTISKFNPSDIEVEQINIYEEASNEFEQLVADGLIKKRGYNLSTIDQKRERISFNK
jgi:hypothetical protein